MFIYPTSEKLIQIWKLRTASGTVGGLTSGLVCFCLFYWFVYICFICCIIRKTKEKPLIGAEIGVASGKHAKQILNFLNIKQLVLVDPWKVYSDDWQADNTSPKGLDKFDDTFHENNYKKTVKKFSNNPKVKIIRDYSVNAAKMFDDKYFDFVYLDGDHSYEGVKKDLDSWYPKLKKFGVMCGDDYGNMHLPVIEAVSEFVYEHKLLVTCSEDKQFWFVKV